MKNMIERLLEARAARREDREAGFSLIELIVVIAIIGILIAIAIPVYGNIQQNAKNNQVKNAAATAATQVGAKIAQGQNAITFISSGTAGAATVKAPKGIALSITPTTGQTLDNFCVTADDTGSGSDLNGADAATSGPGCAS